MELKTYLLIILKKWWIVIPTFLITLTTTIYITYTTTPTYTATATYVVAPSSSFADVRDYTAGLNILSNREEIVATYTEVAVSSKVKQMAADSIGLESTKGYSIESDLIRGTNVLKITASGPDPVITRDLANAVGAVTTESVKELYEVYQLSALDEAKVPRFPTHPDKVRNLALAAALGLILGGGIALLVAYLESPGEAIVSVNIVDGETGAYNKQYFLQRLGEEMIRAMRNHYPLSVALMRANNLKMVRGFNASRVRSEALRHLAVLAKQFLREEDVVAYLGDHVFGFLLLDTPGRDAQAVMEYLQTRIAWAPFRSEIIDVKLNLNGIVGVAAYDHNGTGRDHLMDLAAEALQLAEVNKDGRVYLKSDAQS